MVEVSAALIWSDGTFLICRRPPHKARGNLWEFVGGKREIGESGEEALVRECREELDVEIRVLSQFFDVIHVYPDISIHLTVYNSVILNGTPKLLEHTDIRWITADEISEYEFCPADEEILKKIEEEYGK